MTIHMRVRLAVLGGLALVAALPTAAQAGSQSFHPQGEYTFTVPAGVRSLHVVAVGAPGGGLGPMFPSEAFGAVASADIPVSSGQVLYAYVGGPGGFGQAVGGGAGGFNGGGASGHSQSGGGGGASDVRTIPMASPGSLASRLVTAGGGGGDAEAGGDGGVAGSAGANAPSSADCMSPAQGGGGGSAAGAGAGGAGAGAAAGAAGQSGSLGIGGTGGPDPDFFSGGGGGGGGVFGGGGGGGSPTESGQPCGGGGGGGGGSGFAASATNTSVTTASDGTNLITLSWTEPPDTTITAGPEEGVTIASASPTFAFSSAPAGLAFECKVDGSSFTACASPTQIGPLANGAHTFAVRAVDDGSVDPTPPSRNFTIDNCTVPKIKRGTRRGAVTQKLAEAGCMLGKVTKKFSSKVKRRRLIRLKVKPATVLAPDAAIDAVFSKGPR